MIITARVAIPVSSKEFSVRTFTIDIPDDIIEEYARNALDLLTREEAVEYVADNPPDNDYEPD